MDSNSWEIIEATEYNNRSQNDEQSKSFTDKDENESEKAEIDDYLQCNSDNRYGQNVKNYELEWRDLCIMVSTEPNLEKLRTVAISGDLKISKFRSVIWNILLGALGTDPNKWTEERAEQRRKYCDIKRKYILDPTKLKVAQEEDNPLSQSKSSLWNQHFCDVDLRNLIQQDVTRTNPNVNFYHKETIQEIMMNILFCYAREYPTMCYRQGMHEILAPLIFVLHCDHQSLGHIQEETNVELDPILVAVLDLKHLEEDSYLLFCKLMSSLELFYRVNDMTISESGQLSYIPIDPESPKKSQDKKTSEIEVIHQLNMVRDKIFAKHDLHLHNHLLKLEIPLGLFGIRWLRLLFGREFNLLDLLILWDAIFGIGDNLKFTYYIVVAMLIHIRDRLLTNDYTSCLTFLMRYPTNADVSIIIRHALYMCEPDKYQCPPNAFVYVINSMRPRRLVPAPGVAKRQPVPAVMSSPRKLSDQIQRETVKNQTKAQSEDGVVDGYAPNDPELLRMELTDSYNIMAVTRLKLIQYVTILRKYIPGNQVDELHQTMDGIEELCTLLKPKNQFVFEDISPIDAALEADDEEPTASSSKHKHSFPMAQKLQPSISYEPPDQRVSRAITQKMQRNRREVEMNVIRSSVLGCVDVSRYPQEDPAGEATSSD